MLLNRLQFHFLFARGWSHDAAFAELVPSVEICLRDFSLTLLDLADHEFAVNNCGTSIWCHGSPIALERVSTGLL